ncbi:MAG: hypothetical protein ACI9BW_004200 [Gammaproteobacteria bacterium]|jgi:hypothetical protein
MRLRLTEDLRNPTLWSLGRSSCAKFPHSNFTMNMHEHNINPPKLTDSAAHLLVHWNAVSLTVIGDPIE